MIDNHQLYFLDLPNFGHFVQLLTYRPEEGPSEDANIPNDEPEVPPPEEDVITSSEVEDTTPPPPPPPEPQNMDTGDLLVINAVQTSLEVIRLNQSKPFSFSTLLYAYTMVSSGIEF